MRGPQKRSSRLKFSCVDHACLNVARLAAASIHHLAPEWVSQVRKPAKEDTLCHAASVLGRHGDAKPHNSNKSAKRKATSMTELLMKLLKIRHWWKMFLLPFKSLIKAENFSIELFIRITWFTSPVFHFCHLLETCQISNSRRSFFYYLLDHPKFHAQVSAEDPHREGRWE